MLLLLYGVILVVVVAFVVVGAVFVVGCLCDGWICGAFDAAFPVCGEVDFCHYEI